MPPNPINDQFLKDLCSRCKTIDFSRITRPTYPCNRNQSENHPFSVPDPKNPNLDLGSVKDIKGQKTKCRICTLVKESLMRQKHPLDPTGRCVFQLYREFASFSRTVPGFDNRTHFHTTRAQVLYQPPGTTALGPVAPWQDEVGQDLKKGARIVLQLQAASQPRLQWGADKVHGFIDEIGGRAVGKTVDYKVLRNWLSICQTRHGATCSAVDHVDKALGPSTVINVKDMCLEKTPSNCSYVALSYVWGDPKKAPMFKNEKAITAKLHKKQALINSPLPKTIQDSIALVRGMGLQYLWVDALCIVQDDKNAQQGEMARMGGIYSKALLTIIASFGDAANAGLPGIREGSREQLQQKIPAPGGDVFTTIDEDGIQSGIAHSVWNTRAWTFQERIFSKRCLVFTENQAYWQCRCNHFMEEMTLEGTTHTHLTDIDFKLFKVSAAQTVLDRDLPTTALQPVEYMKMYSVFLGGYSQRNLTNMSDKLNAFDGIASSFSYTQKDKFFGGIPESCFSWALSWTLSGQHYRHNATMSVPVKGAKDPKQVPIPSWSWAAWTGDYNPWIGLAGATPPPASKGAIYEPLVEFQVGDDNGQWTVMKERFHQTNAKRPKTAAGALPVLRNQITPSQYKVGGSALGHLRFWSEIARLRVHRVKVDPKKSREGSNFSMGERGDEFAFKINPRVLFSEMDHLPWSKPDPKTKAQTCMIEFVLIGEQPGGHLKAMAVECDKNGVRSRLGMAEFGDPSDWLRIPTKDKKTELITLG